MATIQSISGKYDPAKSKLGSLWVLLADEQNIFEVPEWIPQTKEARGKLTPPTPADIETPKTVTWTLMDMSKKEILHIYKSDTLQKLPITINKQYSGNYSYYLKAALDGTKKKAGIYIKGYTPSLITVFNWGKDNTHKDKGELKQGESIYVHIETEGLNGDKLKLEIYDQTENKTVKEFDAECVNGVIEASFNTLGLVKLEPNTNKTLCIKLKLISGVYIKDTSSKEELATFTINDKIQAIAQVPQNITPLKVGKPDKNMTTTGFISLERIQFTTNAVIANDSIASIDDLWVLQDIGKYFHWLNNSIRNDVHHVNYKSNQNKPSIIPVCIDSVSKIEFTATFKTIFPIDARVRVRDRENQYTFTIENYPKSVANGQEYEITFTSQTAPYRDTVQYFPNLELIFDYSLDGKSWTPLGSTQFCLYITWKDSALTYGDFDPSVKDTFDSKNIILESLLFLGCSNAIGLGKNGKEVEVIDAIFKPFEGRRITRAREARPRPNGTNFLPVDFSSVGLGYWRGESAAANTSAFEPVRSLRFLLEKGEARCGEWTRLFQNILLAQGIDVAYDTIGICTEYGFLYAKDLSGKLVFSTYTENSSKYKAKPISYQFAVKNAMHNDVSDFNSTVGDSPGQGTSQSEPVFVDHFWFIISKINASMMPPTENHIRIKTVI